MEYIIYKDNGTAEEYKTYKDNSTAEEYITYKDNRTGVEYITYKDNRTAEEYITLAWEPSRPALPRLLIVTPAVYPHLNDFTGKQNLCY